MLSQHSRDPTLKHQSRSSPRKPLGQRSESESNSNLRAAVRLVPKTPPRLLGHDNEDDAYYYSQTPLPTLPAHIPSPRKTAVANATVSDTHISEFQNPSKSGFVSASPHGLTAPSSPIKYARPIPRALPQNRPIVLSTGSPSYKPSTKKRQLHIHDDNKTFSLSIPNELDELRPQIGLSREQNVMSTSPSSASSSSWLSDQASISALASRTRRLDQGSLATRSYNSSSTPSLRVTNDFKTTPTSDKPKKQILRVSIKSSPCNNEFVGGLRKVAETPDHKQQKPGLPDQPFTRIQHSEEVYSLTTSHDLSSKPSFSSTNSTSSETTNYKTYGDDISASGSAHSLDLSSSHLALSTHSFVSANSNSDPTHSLSAPKDIGSSEVSRGSSQSNLSLDSPDYSSSLVVVSPLRLRSNKPPSNHNSDVPLKRRESNPLNSTLSFSTSPKRVLRGLLSANTPIQIPFHSLQLNHSQLASGSWAESLSLHPLRSHMNEYPHQWSSQLSTVLSVSEDGSDRDAASLSERSRISISSADLNSNFRSGNNSQISVSPPSRSQSWNGSLNDAPIPAHIARPRRNSNSSARMVVEPDEYGDGITDMQNMRVKPLRRRTSGYYSSNSSENGRTNTMRSSMSTNSLNLNLSLLPAWAKLYYGTGDERWLAHLSRSSMGGWDSRKNSVNTLAPSLDGAPSNLRTSRNRNHNTTVGGPTPSEFDSNFLSSNQAPGYQNFGDLPQATWNVANLWSPHLRPDKRSKGGCIWGPPSVDYSADGGIFGKRNIQVVMFILGFIFPFSWMIASFLPLPRPPVVEMREDDRTSPTLDIFKSERDFSAIDEARYESAAWWRRLNRWMSLVGVLIIAAVVILVIIGVQQGWGVEDG